MKKFLSLILALAMAACMSVTAFAAEGPGGSTTLTVNVPNKQLYTLHIPADQSIAYKAEKTSIGMAYVTDVDASVKRIDFDSSYDGKLTSGTNTIPYDIRFDRYEKYGSAYALGNLGASDLKPDLYTEVLLSDSGRQWYTNDYFIIISEEAWNAAVPGDYSTTITWTSSYELK